MFTSSLLSLPEGEGKRKTKEELKGTLTTTETPNPFTSTSLASLPEYHLDYSEWHPNLSSTHPSNQRFISSLCKAMVGIGFFYLHNSPLEQSNRRESMYSFTEQFFSLPLQERLLISMEKSRHFRGYCKFGDETTQNQQDLRDQIDYGPEVDPLDPSLCEKFPYLSLYGPNQFLNDEHRQIVLDWFDTANEMARQITRALELALGVEQGTLTRYLQGSPSEMKDQVDNDDEKQEIDQLGLLPYSRMKVIRYPVGDTVDGIQRSNQSQQGVGAHKDGGWLTLLSTTSVGGLEIQDFNGNWLSVPNVSGAILVNFGQQIENVSGGIIQAATHRVVSAFNAKVSRQSVAFFCMPGLNTILHPLDPIIDINQETLDCWKLTRQRKEIVSDISKGDLYTSQNQRFGWIAWKGLVRSHPSVVKRFYPHLLSSSAVTSCVGSDTNS